jgi:NADH-quinone oxidoreductase subunit N
MVKVDFIALLPLLLLVGTAIAGMLSVAIVRDHLTIALMSGGGILASLISILLAWPVTPRQVTPLLFIDRYVLLYVGLILVAALVVTMLSYRYLQQHSELGPSPAREAHGREMEEYYLLLLLATSGATVLISASHFASFLLGLEMLSVSLYVLVAYLRTKSRPLEAGLKYLMLSAASTSFLLFGMALVYFQMGTMEFSRLASPGASGDAVPILVLAGWSLILVGIGFKLAVAPFHMWTPDVYQGAPAPITAFLATVSKGAVFALLLRLSLQVNVLQHPVMAGLFSAIAVASMFVGNLLALLQDNVKRILAYSSIAHLGYLLVAFLASGPFGVEAVTFYLAAYFVTTLGAFGIVTVLSGTRGDADGIEDYRGLLWRRPALAAVFAVMLLSLGGIPLTAGFIGKFYVIAAGVQSSLWGLVLLLVLNSVIGLFYYLRIIVAMTAAPLPSTDVGESPPPSLSWEGPAVLAALTVLLIWLGLFPHGIISLIQKISQGVLG